MNRSLLVIVVAQYAYVLHDVFASTGVYFGDDWLHLLLSREVLHRWSVILSIWGRPAMTAAYIPSARFGRSAVHVEDAVLLAAAVVLTMLIARSLGLRWWPAAGVLLLAQPFTVVLFYGAMPEVVLSVLLALALFLRVRHHRAASLTVASLLPLARLEFLLVLLVWAAVELVADRAAWRQLPLLGAGMVAWWGAATIQSGNPLHLITGNTFVNGAHGFAPAGWRFVFTAGPIVFGGVVCGLLIAAIARRFADPLVPAITGTMIVFYALSWSLGLFQTVDTPIYLVSLCVPVSLLCLNALTTRPGAELPKWRDVIAIGVALLCLFAPSFGTHPPTPALIPRGAIVVALAVLLMGRTAPSRRRSAALGAVVLVAALAITVADEAPLNIDRNQPNAVLSLAMLGDRATRVSVYADLAVGYLAGKPGPPGRFVAHARSGSLGTTLLWESDPVVQSNQGHLSLRQLEALGYTQLRIAHHGRFTSALLQRTHP